PPVPDRAPRHSPRRRSNLLALAVLACLAERPMHPYEMATTLRTRGKHHSIKLNYGSLYSVVDSLERAVLIEREQTLRDGRRPERTIYRITDAGRIELADWESDLLGVPAKEYTRFEAGLSLLPVVPADEAVTLLRQRCIRLEGQLAAERGLLDACSTTGLPRLFVVELEYRARMRQAELEWARSLADEIASGALSGVAWWRAIYDELERAAAEGREPVLEELDWGSSALGAPALDRR
ncbi:MAG: PadR family transcriptional regulator, partial [Solirubrobacteraceae bacterium]